MRKYSAWTGLIGFGKPEPAGAPARDEAVDWFVALVIRHPRYDWTLWSQDVSLDARLEVSVNRLDGDWQRWTDHQTGETSTRRIDPLATTPAGPVTVTSVKPSPGPLYAAPGVGPPSCPEYARRVKVAAAQPPLTPAGADYPPETTFCCQACGEPYPYGLSDAPDRKSFCRPECQADYFRRHGRGRVAPPSEGE